MAEFYPTCSSCGHTSEEMRKATEKKKKETPQ